MTTLSKWLSLAILLSAVTGLQGQTINAASCSANDVQNALRSVSADGTTVVIPAGNCTWTTTVTYNQVFSTTVQGQTTCSGTPATSCSDNTMFTDGVNGDNPALMVSTAAGKSFRLTGVTFANSVFREKYEGSLRIFGDSQAVRVDHVHFKNIQVTSMRVDGVFGVMDHVVMEMGGGNWNGVKVSHSRWGGTAEGDGSWAAATALGSNQFFFIEDSTINTGTANDCDHGGRFVFRHNNFVNGASTQTHPTGGSGRGRGCRAWEIYANNLSGSSSSPAFNVFFMSSGTGVIWGNTAGTGYTNFVTMHSMRRNNGTYPESGTPNGWGYCGTSFNGSGSAWDQNTNSSTGYPCLDQPGRGKGDLLSGAFPNAVNTATGSISWPRQATEPVYEWQNSWTPVPGYPNGKLWSIYESDVLGQNRDFFLGSDGSNGVRSGSLSARPSSCTAMAAYWASDTNTLYQCSAGNTWNTYYKPYAYPHPLAGGGGSSTGPNAPTGVQAVAR